MAGKKRKERPSSLRSVYNRMIGKEFHVPASFFNIDVPGMFYKFRVVKKDNAHRRAMTVICVDEKGPKHWMPVSLIQQWIEADEQMSNKRQCTNAESDDFAVETLIKLKNDAGRGMDLLDEESANVLLSMKYEQDSPQESQASSPLVRYDLSRAKGFVRLQPSGKFEVRLEGDDDFVDGKPQSRSDSPSVIVQKA